MISFNQRGNFNKTEKFLKNATGINYMQILEKYAQEGVIALSNATPTDSGLTANSWGYKIVKNKRSMSIMWTNSNIQDGVPIAIILQYGHGTRNGGYVQGIDYINPALQPLFNKMADAIWREVKSS